MAEMKDDVLKAEVAIKELARELASAGGVSAVVSEVKQQLTAAGKNMDHSCKILEELAGKIEREMKASRQLTKRIVWFLIILLGVQLATAVALLMLIIR